jgi:hypothetical protein
MGTTETQSFSQCNLSWIPGEILAYGPCTHRSFTDNKNLLQNNKSKKLKNSEFEVYSHKTDNPCKKKRSSGMGEHQIIHSKTSFVAFQI